MSPLHVLVGGASGFLGTHLVDHLRSRGHQVTRLVRRPTTRDDEVQWDPDVLHLPSHALDEVDVVVNLGGSPLVGNPHSRAWSERLLSSRVATTRTVSEAIAERAERGASLPALLAGNGISGYGDHGDQPVAEDTTPHGDSLLSRVAHAWEDATAPARDAGARVCVLRTAVVLDRATLPFKALRPLHRAGLGAVMGTGEQYFPVVSRRDWVGAATFLAEHSSAEGAFNLVCPEVPTYRQLARALSAGRPLLVRVPGAVIRPLAGPMAPELLNSVRAVPAALTRTGYTFTDVDVDAVVSAALRG